MPRSKASAEGDEHLQEFQLLKQDVQENQYELAAVRADLSAVMAKQDQVQHDVNGLQGSISDINLQMTAMADALKSLRHNTVDKPTDGSPSEHNADEHQPQSSGMAADQAMLLQKRLEVENLHRQYALEQEISRRYQQPPPVSR
jgi:chromosome segregation ATPase